MISRLYTFSFSICFNALNDDVVNGVSSCIEEFFSTLAILRLTIFMTDGSESSSTSSVVSSCDIAARCKARTDPSCSGKKA